MINTITINNQCLSIKEWNGQRVITFKDVDLVHNRPDGTARRNFNFNKQHLAENVDFYLLTQPNEIRTLGFVRPQGGTPASVILLTESGYLMLVKSFTDDLAWEVQRALVNSYFKVKTSANSQYSPKATSVGEITNFIKVIDKIAVAQGSSPEKRAETAKRICDQFDIDLGEKYVEPSYEQASLFVIGYLK